MYIPGRLRTASRPSSTWIWEASYSWVTFSIMSAIFPPKYREKPALFLAYSGICVCSAARFRSVALAIWLR